MYVTELVAADTVNTMPGTTLTAFADHGEVTGNEPDPSSADRVNQGRAPRTRRSARAGDICVTELELGNWKRGRHEEAITQHQVPPDP
jgi:transaldolase